MPAPLKIAVPKDIRNIAIVAHVGRIGRRNSYRIHPNVPLKDEVTNATVGELLIVLGWRRGRRRAEGASKEGAQ